MTGNEDNEFEGLEHFKDEILSRIGVYGEEERMAAETAILRIKENWAKRQKGLRKQKDAHYYGYGMRDSIIYDERGIPVTPAGGKPVYLVSASSPLTYFSKAIMAYTDSDYYHVSVALNENLSNLYSFSPIMGQGGPGNRQGGFCSDSIWRYKKEGIRIRVSCVFLPGKDYRAVLEELSEMEKQKERTQYNYQGLLHYVLGRKEETDPMRMFCSQFAMYLLQKAGFKPLGKELCFTAPEDIASLGTESGVYRLFDGESGLYQKGKVRETVNLLMLKNP
ncbi:hypothetical protein D3Z36_16110 [Lachnospiraceae bacterium]|nr:hypothetical protein [Lachnospiraceae bacterium]